jgi:hypothetical protein
MPVQLQKTNKEQESKLEALEQTLRERSNELDLLRKKTNRDIIINNGVHDTFQIIPQPSPLSMHGELPPVREEITGLKYDFTTNDRTLSWTCECQTHRSRTSERELSSHAPYHSFGIRKSAPDIRGPPAASSKLFVAYHP